MAGPHRMGMESVPYSSVLVAGMLLLLSSAALGYNTFVDLDHPLHGKTKEDIDLELHYLHSFGYESPPPPEIADHVIYIPPRYEGSVAHQRELMYNAMHHVEKLHGHRHGVQRRELSVSNTASAAWEDLAPSPAKAAGAQSIPPALAPSGFDNCHPITGSPRLDYNETQTTKRAMELDQLVWYSLQQPDFPVDAPPEVLNATIVNTAQMFGTAPRYSAKFGIAQKSPSTGRWYTFVSKYNWFWGNDDWSTALWSCRYYQPGPNGFDCKYDRTCPGCDRCRGEHCYFNWNRYTYCSDPQCRTNWPITTQFKKCMSKPVLCGVSWRVGTPMDLGWPGFDSM